MLYFLQTSTVFFFTFNLLSEEMLKLAIAIIIFLCRQPIDFFILVM